MQVWTLVWGKAASMACGTPLAVHDRDQDVLDAAVAQIVQHLGPEFGTLVGLKPQAQNVARAVRQDRQRHEDRLVRHCAVAANIDADRVHEHDRIARFQWAVLPGSDLLHHRVGDRGNLCLDAIDFLDMPLDLAGGHAARIHADDLAVELRKAALIFGDQQRVKGAVAIAGDVQKNLPAVGRYCLLAAPVASVWELVLALRCFASTFIVQVNVHLRAQCPLCQRLGQLRKYARLAKQIAGRPAFHQTVQKVFVDAHTWVSFQKSYHARAQNLG